MDRIYLLIMCASIVLLTTAFGLASPQVDEVHTPDQVPLLLRIIPRPASESTAIPPASVRESPRHAAQQSQ